MRHCYTHIKDGHLSDDDPPPNFTLAEAQVHDLSVLPHMHSDCGIEKIFPKIEAAQETANSRDWIPEDEGPTVGPARARWVLRHEYRNTAAEKERKVTDRNVKISSCKIT